jgi:hypothetical protein
VGGTNNYQFLNPIKSRRVGEYARVKQFLFPPPVICLRHLNAAVAAHSLGRARPSLALSRLGLELLCRLKITSSWLRCWYVCFWSYSPRSGEVRFVPLSRHSQQQDRRRLNNRHRRLTPRSGHGLILPTLRGCQKVNKPHPRRLVSLDYDRAQTDTEFR